MDQNGSDFPDFRSDLEQDPDQDPLLHETDMRIRIHISKVTRRKFKINKKKNKKFKKRMDRTKENVGKNF